MLNEVVDGVWVRQREWVSSNATVVRGEGGLTLVDAGINGADLEQLADDVDGLGLPVVAGFSTHPHWDHLLWHARFGDVPRYATAANAELAAQARERAQAMAAESARIAADRAYVDALRRGEDPVDPRLDQDWLAAPHQANVKQARPSAD
jgi:glyoxylase-like metal-dependent hydrolase (beta-lactamase superfamily II)